MALILPIQSVFAAESSSVSIVLMQNFNISYNDADVAVSGDGKYFALSIYGSTGDSNISLYETPNSFTGTAKLKWAVTTTSSREVEIDDEGSIIVNMDEGAKKLAAYSSDAASEVWSITSSNNMRQFALSDNGEYVVYCVDETVGHSLHLIDGSDKSEYWSEPLSVDTRDIAVSNNGKVAIIDTHSDLYYFNTTEMVWANTTIDSAYQVDISNDGNRLIVNSKENTQDMVILFDAEGNILKRHEDRDLSAYGVSMAKDSKDILLSTFVNTPEQVALLSGDSMTEKWEVTTDTFCYYSVINRDGDVAMVSDYDYNVMLFDCASGTKLMTHNVGTHLASLDLSDDGSIAAIMTSTGSLVIYSVQVSGSGFFDSLLNYFTNSENLYGILVTAGGAFLIGGLMFGLIARKRSA